MKKKRFKVISPEMWKDVPSYEESTYDEVVKIHKGIGYCQNQNTVDRLRKFGYTITEELEVTR